MKIKNVYILVLMLIWGSIAFPQAIKLKAIDSIQGDFNTYSVDNLGNIYLCQQDIILKLNSNLDTLFSSSLKSHFPTFIQSVKNFRILTFDSERGIVQFFDNTLTPLTGQLNLYDLDLVQPILVCESFNGNSFWVLDAGTLRLLKVNENFKIINEIENLSFLSDSKVWPNQMFEYNDLLYISTPQKHVMVFDAFGTFIQKFPINTSWISIYKNALLQYIFPQFQFINRLNLDVQTACTWSLQHVTAFNITSKHLYVLNDNGLYIGLINQSEPAKNK